MDCQTFLVSNLADLAAERNEPIDLVDVSFLHLGKQFLQQTSLARLDSLLARPISLLD
jgi:hypothetical protein